MGVWLGFPLIGYHLGGLHERLGYQHDKNCDPLGLPPSHICGVDHTRAFNRVLAQAGE